MGRQISEGWGKLQICTKCYAVTSETTPDRAIVTIEGQYEEIAYYQMVSYSMTLSDPQPGFQGHCILKSQISQKRCVLGTKLLKNTNRKPSTLYRMVQHSMTLSDL